MLGMGCGGVSILIQKYTEYFSFNFQKEIERIVSKPDKTLISIQIGKATDLRRGSGLSAHSWLESEAPMSTC